MRKQNNIEYFERINRAILKKLSESDISPIESELKKDCCKCLVGYVLILIIDLLVIYFCFSSMFNQMILQRFSFSGVIALITLVLLPVMCVVGIFLFSKALIYRKYKGIKGICDNITVEKGYRGVGKKYVYHCTTELRQQGIACTPSKRANVSIGDSVLYIRICNHDLIYRI